MSGNNGCPNDENAFERMVRQTRALSGSPCEHEGEACYGCATCFARDTVKMLDAESAPHALEETMRRFYYFGCRGTEGGHYLHGDNRSAHADHLDGGFPVHLLDGTFAPLERSNRDWRLTQLRFNHHVVSILSCHDDTIEKRPGGNAAFVVVDSDPWDAEHILADARGRYPDCWERLRNVRVPETR